MALGLPKFGRRPQGGGYAALWRDGDVVHAAAVTRGAAGSRPAVALCCTERAAPADAASVYSRLATLPPMRRRRCTTLLPPGSYRMLVADAPKVPPEELAEALRWQVRDMVDFDVSDAIVDTLPVATRLDGSAGRASLHVVVAQRDAVEACAGPFRSQKLPLAAVDVREFALRNIAALFPEPGSGTALAWFGERSGALVFVAGGELCLYRPIDVAGPQLDAAIEGSDPALLDRIELSLQRSLDHFERQFADVPLSRLRVVASPAGRDLAQLLSGRLTLPVELAELDQAMEFAEPGEADWLSEGDSGDALLAVGAALRDD